MSTVRAAVQPVTQEISNPFGVYVEFHNENVLKIGEYVSTRFLKTMNLEESEEALTLLNDAVNGLKNCQNNASRHTRKYITGEHVRETGHNTYYDGVMNAGMKIFLEYSALIKQYKVALNAAKWSAQRR